MPCRRPQVQGRHVFTQRRWGRSVLQAVLLNFGARKVHNPEFWFITQSFLRVFETVRAQNLLLLCGCGGPWAQNLVFLFVFGVPKAQILEVYVFPGLPWFNLEVYTFSRFPGFINLIIYVCSGLHAFKTSSSSMCSGFRGPRKTPNMRRAVCLRTYIVFSGYAFFESHV